MRFFSILSNDPFIRFQYSIERLRALIVIVEKEIKAEHFKDAKEEFKNIQRMLDKNIDRNTIVHLLEKEKEALKKVPASQEKESAEENLQKAEEAIKAIVLILPNVITVLERIEKNPRGYKERSDNPKVLEQWIRQFEELVETLRMIARVEEELFRKAEKVGIKTNYDPKFKGKPLGYLSNENMYFFVKGTPKQIIYIYYVFVNIDTVRLLSGMDPTQNYFPPEIPLNDFHAMTKKVNPYTVKHLMEEKAIQFLQKNKDSSFASIKEHINTSENSSGGRIDYGNNSYIKIKTKESVKKMENNFPKMRDFLETIDENTEIILQYNCREKSEFENVGKFSMYKALTFLHIPILNEE